ncbi:MAG: peroxide stress protein YaaA [Candidatus Marinimicrobia bacterium]|nr:peroxide stress protein YaaA [Candidatus Neomarinimicrobiota bacterium]
MITVLSPAKKLSSECSAYGTIHSHPQFLDASQNLVNRIKEFDPPKLQSLMGISEKLSEINWERYQSWSYSAGPEKSREAIFTFMGDTYSGLDAFTLSTDDITFAQDNTRILSGLYGILKPLDLIQPYRLEMGTKLENESGKNLYFYWNSSLSNSINRELKVHRNSSIINCASIEYFKSINNPDLQASVVITPQFKENKNGKYRMISFYAKKARGMMARYIIQNRIEDPKDILSFNLDGYSYNKTLSTELDPVFTRYSS